MTRQDAPPFPPFPIATIFFVPLGYNGSNLWRAQLRMQERLQIKGEVRRIIQ
jgi:hypothetical protein